MTPKEMAIKEINRRKAVAELDRRKQVESSGATETQQPPLEQKFKDVFGIRQSTPEEKERRQQLIEGVVPPLAGTLAVATAPASLPVMALAGGLGTAIGSQLTQKEGERTGTRTPQTLSESSWKAAQDVAVGGAEEILGQKVLGPAMKTAGELVGKGLRAVSPLSKDAMRRASDLYKKLTPDAKAFSDTVDAAKALEKEIPGYRISQGQRTKDYGTLMFEAGSGQDVLQDKLYKKNLIAIQNYLENAKGKGSLDAALNRLEAHGISVDKNLYNALENLERAQFKYNPVIDKELSGQAVLDTAGELEAQAIKQYGAAFDVAIEPTIPTHKLLSNAERILKEGSRVQLSKNTPAILSKFTKVFGKKGKERITHISPKELQDIRSELSEEIRIERGGSNNRFKVKKMMGFTLYFYLNS